MLQQQPQQLQLRPKQLRTEQQLQKKQYHLHLLKIFWTLSTGLLQKNQREQALHKYEWQILLAQGLCLHQDSLHQLDVLLEILLY